MYTDKFLSARPGRGATVYDYESHVRIGVSIRTPRAGRDAAIWIATSAAE